MKGSFVATSNNVTPTPVRRDWLVNGTDLQSKIISNNETFKKKGGKIIQSSCVIEPNKTKVSPARYGFVSSVLNAYNGHHNLILRPDDVWQAILTQFSFYVNASAEALRDNFVAFQGKKVLVVEMPGSLYAANYGTFVKRMVDEEIPKNLKDATVTDWLLPNFTTTKDTDRVVAAVSIMSTLQAYFEYKCCLCCGIPKVTLLGTVRDWQTLRKKIDGLLQYEASGRLVMEKWHGLLTKVIDGFVASAEGNPDLRFWDTVASEYGGGSGPSYLSGWLTVFACFRSDGKWQGNVRDGRDWPQIDTDKIPLGTVSVPVKINDNGTEYESTMTAGQFGYEVIGNALDTIQPRSDWCIAIPSSTSDDN